MKLTLQVLIVIILLSILIASIYPWVTGLRYKLRVNKPFIGMGSISKQSSTKFITDTVYIDTPVYIYDTTSEQSITRLVREKYSIYKRLDTIADSIKILTGK